jgi:syntaxin 8
MRNKYSTVPTGEYDDANENRKQPTGLLALRRAYRDQDEQLDALGSSVARLGEMSLGISKEIDTQNRMLSSLENEIDNNSAKANDLTQRTKDLINRSGGSKSFCLIVFLTLILLFLIFLVIYT